VATGTGIAPFCSMARSGIFSFTILHGVRSPVDLYYASQLQQSARKYIPCLSDAKKSTGNAFQGKVTEYLEQHLTPGAYDFYYDFYLCGRREMIRDVTLLIDERFPGSLVYTELFY
jgi:NAD(P)H-flavin reductase